MRLRHKPWAADKLKENDKIVVTDPEAQKGKWQARFAQKQPLHIEVGSGKGRFIVEMAKAHPENNYVAIEIQESVIVMVLDKALLEQLPNLQLLHANGADLDTYFENGEVDRVYLNFSDPWPKTKHAKRRLTSEKFLKTYQTILVPKGEIHFKTDNRGLFEYSLESFSAENLLLKKVWLDLHKDEEECQTNIMTEYEEKFSAKGQPIYKSITQFKI